MNILVSVNKKYVRYLLVLMASVYLNHPEEKADFYVLGQKSELEGEAEAEIVAYAESWNQKAFVLRVPEEQWASFPTTPRWSVEVFFWLMAHEYLPKDMERCLKLDVDMVVDRNIGDFYHMDFQGNYLAACYSAYSKARFPDGLYGGPNVSRKNCNAGVALLNLPLWRENITLQTWIDAAAGYKGLVTDERRLNLVLGEHIFVREACYYNCCPDYYNSYAEEGEKRGINIAPPSIIHYLAARKPWDAETGNSAFFAVWWRYAKLTPHYRDLLLEMRAKTDYYERVVVDVYQKQINQLKKRIENLSRFLMDLYEDSMSNRRFQTFLESYRGKSVSVLKETDKAARIFLSNCKRYDMKVLFRSPSVSLSFLSDSEFAQCRKADVIVNCNVHGDANPERDGVLPVMVWDILKSPEQEMSVALADKNFPS